MIAAALALVLAAPDAGALAGPTYLGPKPPAQVRRVVTIAPSLTETVIALGAGDRLVGVSRFDERAEVAKLPRIGGFVDPSVEAVIALKPDLVLVQPGPGNQAPVQKMAELGVPVLALPMHSISAVVSAIREAGRALGAQARADALVEHIEQTRASIRARARSLPKPKVLIAYDFEPLVVAGPGSFAAELLSDAGGINAAKGATQPYPTWSVESALEAKPEVVLDLTHASQGAARLRSLGALARARWVRPRSEDLMHPGPRLAEGLEELFALIHADGRDPAGGRQGR